MNQVTIFRDDENGRRDAVNGNNVSLISHGESGDDVDVTNCDLLDVVTVLGKDLHSRTFISAITDDKLAVGSHYGHLSREPQLTFFLAGNAEMELERAVLLKDLQWEFNYFINSWK